MTLVCVKLTLKLVITPTQELAYSQKPLLFLLTPLELHSHKIKDKKDDDNFDKHNSQ